MYTTVLFTDGSSRGNPGPGGYGAICACENSKGELLVTELGGREALTTNNRMELQALISALDYMQDFYGKEDEVTFNLFIDSSYVVKGAKEWLANWKRKNWITSTKEEVKNFDLWQTLDTLLEKHKDQGIKFKWNLIKGHAGTPGNERCDEIATAFADNKKPDLYKGHPDQYPLGNIFCVDEIVKGGSAGAKVAGEKSSSKNKKAGAGYSYISLVDGVLNIDKTWAECEKRVKGKNAKFKKAMSKSEEDEIVASFKAL